MSSRRSPHNRLIEIAPLALGAVLAVAVFAAASAVVAAPGASAERVASRPAVKRCVPGRPSADHGRSLGRRSDRECCPPGLGRDRRTGRAEPPGKPSCDGASTADDHAASSWEAIARLRAEHGQHRAARVDAALFAPPSSPALAMA